MKNYKINSNIHHTYMNKNGQFIKRGITYTI